MNAAAPSSTRFAPRSIAFYGACFEAAMLPFSIAAAQWGIGVMFLGWLVWSIRERKFGLSLGPLTVPFLVYIAIFLICSAFAVRAGHSMYSVWDNEWLALSAALLVWIAPDERELRRLIGVFVFCAVLGALFGIFQHLTGFQIVERGPLFKAYPVGQGWTYRPIGFFSHTLSFGYDMGMTLFVVLGLALYHEGPARWLRIAALSTMSLAIVASFSRSSWFAVIATGSALALTNLRDLSHRWLLAMLAAAVAVMFLAPVTRERAELVGKSDNPDRIVYWGMAWHMFLDHPILGIGADNWDYYFPQYRPVNTTAPLETPDHPHNEYLNILSSAGIGGLLAYLWLWGAFILSGYRAAHRSTSNFDRGVILGGVAAIVCMLLAQVTQDIFHDFTNQLMWWFVAGLALVAMRHDRSHSHQPS